MSIQVTAAISPATITLGQTVTVTYSVVGAQDTQILADNMAGIPLSFGSGTQSGTLKLLPLWSGPFNVIVSGNGNEGADTFDMSVVQVPMVCQVN